MIKEKKMYTLQCDNCKAEIGDMEGAEFDSFDSPETAKEYFTADLNGRIETFRLESSQFPTKETHYCDSCYIYDRVDEDRKGMLEPVPVDKRMFTQSGILLPPPASEGINQSVEVGIFLTFKKERFRGYYCYNTNQWYVTLWNKEYLTRLNNISNGLGIEFEKLQDVFYQIKSKNRMDGDDYRQLISLGFPITKALATLRKCSINEVNQLIASGGIDYNQIRSVVNLVTSEGGVFHELMKVKDKFNIPPQHKQHYYFETPTEEVNSFFYL